jgi:hypothetical protein
MDYEQVGKLYKLYDDFMALYRGEGRILCAISPYEGIQVKSENMNLVTDLKDWTLNEPWNVPQEVANTYRFYHSVRIGAYKFFCVTIDPISLDFKVKPE